MTSPAQPLGVVLAGGASSRMGVDKATLHFEGLSLAERAVRTLAAVCPEVVLADGARWIVPGFSSLADGPGQGPVAGILGAAAAFPGRELLVLACDLPYLPAALLAELCTPSRADWVVPRWERGLEPLAALYRGAALATLRQRALAGHLGLRDLAAENNLEIRYLEDTALARFGAAEQIFFNLNRPEDFGRLAPSDQRRLESEYSDTPGDDTQWAPPS